jgi:endonuclease/exonuclease/phosphatase (EEP) superfamily protein YafD
MTEIVLRAAVFVVWITALLVVVMTVIPLWHTTLWWVRAMDFPRLQIAAVAGVVLVAALFLLSGPGGLLVAAVMLVAGGYQLWRIFPYTPIARVEVQLAEETPNAIRIVSSNVLMENRRHDLVLEMIAAFDPDILLLMETDEAWVDALEPALGRYPTVLREPLDNHYGMVFATRLDVRDARIVRLTRDNTPSVFAEIVAPEGTAFRFVGLHPRPPVPGESAKDRDAQILYAARFAAKSGIPVVVTGDFNDVAWSDTSQLFKHVGEYVDPRIGRGFFASFDANSAWLRFPIDQFYATPDVAIISIERLAYVGSDHFPMATVVRLDPGLGARLNTPPPPLSASEREELDKSVARTREELGHRLP